MRAVNVWLCGERTTKCLTSVLAGGETLVGKCMSTKKSGGVNRIVRYFLAGLFAILPLLITVIAITWTLGFLGQLVGPNTFLGNQLSKIGLNFVDEPNRCLRDWLDWDLCGNSDSWVLS